MRDLNYQIKQICQRNRDGSIATQSNRERILTQSANRLHDLGYSLQDVHSLKPKHVQAVVKSWHDEGLSVGTIKNRLAELRWLAQKINKQNIIPKDNARLGIEDRQFATNQSKARTLTDSDLAKVADAHSAMSLRLQAAFGLRREESIKIIPSWADRGDRLALRDTWTKGGRARSVPIRTAAQRAVLDAAKALAGRGSLIPADKNYVQQLRRFEYQRNRSGIHKVHGHRHFYAQQRYEQLTGWRCPACGGPTAKQLTPSQKSRDTAARVVISRELGHERISITVIYLGH